MDGGMTKLNIMGLIIRSNFSKNGGFFHNRNTWGQYLLEHPVSFPLLTSHRSTTNSKEHGGQKQNRT